MAKLMQGPNQDRLGRCRSAERVEGSFGLSPSARLGWDRRAFIRLPSFQRNDKRPSELAWPIIALATIGLHPICKGGVSGPVQCRRFGPSA
jgi:hypothetical protein